MQVALFHCQRGMFNQIRSPDLSKVQGFLEKTNPDCMNTHRCPVCDHKLQHVIEIDKGRQVHVIWCSNGPCPSQVANDGAEGCTLEEAFKKLRKNIDKELDS